MAGLCILHEPSVRYDGEFLACRPDDSPALPTVYHFRPFRNSDPPRIAEIWRSQPPQRGVMQPMSAGLLEQLVFSKPYFDPEGLFVALFDSLPIGFAHAGFGPNEAESAICTEVGTTYQLMLRDDHRDTVVADELLARSEAYLRERGAKVLYSGGIRPLNGFYLGLYGGSELPGVLVNDRLFGETCLRKGYREIDRVQVVQLELSQFRPPVTRQQRQLRRDTICEEENCPPLTTWWDANTTGAFERIRFSLRDSNKTVGDCPNLSESARKNGTVPFSETVLLESLRKSDGAHAGATVWFWDIEPLSTCWGLPTAGMFDLEVECERRRAGLATYLLSEAFARLRARGIRLVEAQTMQNNSPALSLYRKLGFTQVDEGIIYRKE